MNNTVLEINNLTKYYGKVKGVENLSLTLKGGEIFGFIGPNGAGKSTTIRSVMNLIKKDKGSVRFNGKEFDGKDIEAKSMIGYLPSEVFLYDDLSVKSVFDFHEGFYKGFKRAEGIHERRLELTDRLKLDESKMIEDLSLGNLKKVGIILALMHNPALIIMDEPTSGLDPIMQNIFYEILKEERSKGNTVFYSTHILSEVSKICDRVGIIRNGELIRDCHVDEISENRLSLVTLKSEKAEEIVNKLGVKLIGREGNTVRFANSLEDDVLIKRLSEFRIDRILIEEATLEDLFMHYYTEE
ncbi:MAG: ABC transporter ATP-binding protein [Lachnospiraceae bacterium]|nr:ABC transporter ATP-binding protein [Lachnospiraceae bacterium]